MTKIKRNIPAHKSAMVFDTAVDLCEDHKEVIYHTKENTNIYWFKTDQLRKLIKEAMYMGYDAAMANNEQEKV